MMKKSAYLSCLFFISSVSHAEGFQSYEAGSYPIRSRIEAINKAISGIEFSLKSPDLSTKDKEPLNECLQQYMDEKKQLESDLEAGQKIHNSGAVNYLTSKTMCSSLTHPSSGTGENNRL